MHLLLGYGYLSPGICSDTPRIGICYYRIVVITGAAHYPSPASAAMGKRSNIIAARIRILQKCLDAAGCSLSLQDTARTLHQHHVDLLGHQVHFGSHAAGLCLSRGLTSRAHHHWAKAVHHDAASERHNIYPMTSVGVPISALIDLTWPPCPPSAIECSALETTLLAARDLKDHFSFNPDAPCFAPFSGDAHHLGELLCDNSGVDRVVSEPAHSSTDCLVPTWCPMVVSDRFIGTWDAMHINIDFESLVFSLTDKDIIDQRLDGDTIDQDFDRCIDTIIDVTPAVTSITAATMACHALVSVLLAGLDEPLTTVSPSDICVPLALALDTESIDTDGDLQHDLARVRLAFSSFRRKCNQFILWDCRIAQLVGWDSDAEQVCSYHTAQHGWQPYPISLDVFRRLPIASDSQLLACSSGSSTSSTSSTHNGRALAPVRQCAEQLALHSLDDNEIADYIDVLNDSGLLRAPLDRALIPLLVSLQPSPSHGGSILDDLLTSACRIRDPSAFVRAAAQRALQIDGKGKGKGKRGSGL